MNVRGRGVRSVFVAAILSVLSPANAHAEAPAAGAKAPVKRPVVSGRVLDEGGAPIAGAVVEWGTDKQPFAKRQRVTANERGEYSITLKSRNNRCHFVASAKGYSPEFGDPKLPDGRQDCDFKLNKTLTSGQYLTGTVVDDKGATIAGVRVKAFTPVVGFYSSFSSPTGRDYFPGPDRVATTDKDGRFRIEDLPTEEVQLNLTSKHRHVNDTNYSVRENLHIAMSGSGKAGVLQGRIVVAATGETPADLGDIRIVPRYFTDVYECSGDNGRFQLPTEVTLGREYIVYVYGKRFAPADARITAVGRGSKAFAKVKLIDAPPLRGKVVDAETGKPIVDAPLMYGIADEAHYIEWSTFDKTTDGYHSFKLVQHVKSNKRGGFWFSEPVGGSRGAIFVFADGYQRLMLRPDAREIDSATGELIIRLPRESAFTGVLTKNGRPLANRSVSVGGSDPNRFSNMYESVRTDAQGKFRYGRLAAGTYHLAGGGYTRLVSVGPGETKAVNFGDDLGPIRIHGKATPGMSISLSPKFDWDYTTLTTTANAAGEYEIRGLRPGKYNVSQYQTYNGGFIDSSDIEIEVKDKVNEQQIDLLSTPDVNLDPVPAEVLPTR